MDARTVAIVILLVALAGFAVAYWVVGPGRRGGLKRRGDIPLAMRPYHSDDELETTAIERAMAWGVALSLFMAFFLPVYWLIEPVRIQDKQDQFYDKDVNAGRIIFANSCASCHGEFGEGGSAPHPDASIDAPWPAPRLNNIVARYADNDNVVDIEAFVHQTVAQGRPGTPMPPWGAGFAGSFNDLELIRVVAYVLAIQQDDVASAEAFVGQSGEELFGNNCARCHGEQAEGYVGPALTGVIARYGGGDAAEAAVRHTIRNGLIVPTGAPMPAWEGVLTADAIERIVSYLQSIQS